VIETRVPPLVRLNLLSDNTADCSDEVDSDGPSFAFIAGQKLPAD
jgi:hypothetical protein